MKEIVVQEGVETTDHKATSASTSLQDARYLDATKLCGPSLSRLICGYEKDASRRQDLTQDVHLALWKSFELFEERCSLQTWVYRIAHNVAIRHMMNNKRIRLNELHALEEIPDVPSRDEHAVQTKDEHLQRLFSLIEQLKPMDRQVILLYLEEQDARMISELTGLSMENVATKIHRIKKTTASDVSRARFVMSDQHEEVNMGSTVWQSQPVEAPRISLEFIQHQSEKKSHSLKNERDMFYVVVAGIFAIWLISAFKNGLVIHSPMDIVSSIFILLFSLALACMVLHVHKHARMKSPATDADVVGGLAVYRSELERRLQISHREWHVLFYVAPSYLTLLIGGLIFDQRPGKAWRYGLMIAVVIVGACFASWVGRKRSRCLQRELDAIDSLK